MAPDASPVMMAELLQSHFAASQLGQSTQRVLDQLGFDGSGLPNSGVMSSFFWNFISPNSCHTDDSSYPAYRRMTRSKFPQRAAPASSCHILSSSFCMLAALAFSPSGRLAPPPY